jgi:hypothetical protein
MRFGLLPHSNLDLNSLGLFRRTPWRLILVRPKFKIPH